MTGSENPAPWVDEEQVLRKTTEIAIFLFLSLLLVLAPLAGRFYGYPFLGLGDFEEALEALIRWFQENWPVLVNGVLLFALLMLPRFRLRPAPMLAAAVACVAVGYGFIVLIHELPTMRAIWSMEHNLTIGRLVPEVAFHARILLLPLFPLTVGVLASLGMRNVPAFLASWTAAFLLVGWTSGWPDIVRIAGVGELMKKIGVGLLPFLLLPAAAWLPGQRAALREFHDGVTDMPPRGALFVLFVLSMVFAAGLLMSHRLFLLQRETAALLHGNLQLPSPPEGAVNARDALAPLFFSGRPDVDATEKLLALPNADALSEEDLTIIDQWEPVFAPYISAWQEAAAADYLRFSGDGLRNRKHLGNFRQTSRYLTLRAHASIVRGERDKAKQDIDLLLRLAWLINHDDSGHLAHHMVGAGLRREANGAMQALLLAARNDRAELEDLRQWMDERESLYRVPFPTEILRRTEFAMRPWVILYRPLLHDRTTLSSAWPIYHHVMLQTDMIVAGIAIELHRHVTGDYPPDLAALIPHYLDQIPHDPVSGEPIVYTRIEAGFQLLSGEADSPAKLILEP